MANGANILSGYLSLPGASGNYASTPHAAAFNLASGFDIRFRVALDDFTPATANFIIGKNGSSSTRSWGIDIETNTTSRVVVGWSADGTNPLSASSLDIGAIDGLPITLRVVFNPNNGSNRTIAFYKSTNYDPVTGAGTWTQIGTTTTGATTSIMANTAAVEIGSRFIGTSLLAAGKFYWVEIRDVSSAVVDVVSFDQQTYGAPNFTTLQSNVWTINSTAPVTPAGDPKPWDVAGVIYNTLNKIVAKLIIPSGFVVPSGVLLTGGTGSTVVGTTAVPAGDSGLYLGLSELTTEVYSAAADLGGTNLPNTTNRPYLVEARVVAGGTDMTSYAAIKAAFEASTNVVFTPDPVPSIQGGFQNNGAWYQSSTEAYYADTIRNKLDANVSPLSLLALSNAAQIAANTAALATAQTTLTDINAKLGRRGVV